jgi:hypothetical protein
MYDPEGDLNAVFSVLTKDSELMKLLGWETNNLKSQYVWKSNKYPYSFPNAGSRILLYFDPSRTTRNPLVSEEILRVDCHYPDKEANTGMKIQKRVRELLHLKTVNGKQLWWAGQIGDLASTANYNCLAVRYRYSIVV